MIYRNILFKLSQATNTATLDRIQEYVARIQTEIAEVKTYHFARNDAARNADDFNWVLFAAFEDTDAMEAYRIHPLHQEFVTYCDGFTDDFVAVFYQGPKAKSGRS